MTEVDRAQHHPPNPVVLMSIIRALTGDAKIRLLNSPRRAPALLCLLTAEAQTAPEPVRRVTPLKGVPVNQRRVNNGIHGLFLEHGSRFI